jgi:hypothetical protein
MSLAEIGRMTRVKPELSPLLGLHPTRAHTTCRSGYRNAKEIFCGGAWTLQDTQGAAQWPNGAFALLTLDRLDFDRIVIKRVDSAGSTPGLTAVYTGRIIGNRIEGDVTWSWRATNTGKWSAMILEPNNYTLLNPSLPCGPSFKGSGAEAAARGAAPWKQSNSRRPFAGSVKAPRPVMRMPKGILPPSYIFLCLDPETIRKRSNGRKRLQTRYNYFGQRCLSRMYENGQGVAKNSTLAEYWNTKAVQTKASLVLTEQREQEARQRVQAQQAYIAQQTG